MTKVLRYLRFYALKLSGTRSGSW